MYGTSATKKPQYISPRYDSSYAMIDCAKIGYVSEQILSYSKSLSMGYGVSIPQLQEILENGML